jgi:hypothetical protein
MWRALRRRLGGSEEGSAVVEFTFLAVLLLVPVVYLVMLVARVQAGAYAVSLAARESGRAYVTASSIDGAAPRAEAAARLAFDDHGFDGGGIAISCSAEACLVPEATVGFRAELDVPLPLVPAFARGVVPLHVPVSASYVATVDRFREDPDVD